MNESSLSVASPRHVVLLHGAHNDHSVWDAQARALQGAGYAVLAPDLPGHGRDEPALRSVEAMADWLLGRLDANGVGQAVLCGHSMGSLVALEAASRAPGRVTALALVGTAFPMRVADALLQTARDDEAAAIEMVTRWSHSAHGAELAGATRNLMQRMSAANPELLLHADLFACNAYANGEAAAASVHCPVLFVVGTQDKMTPPRASAALVKALQHARVVSVDAGHAMMAEAPDAVSAALLELANAAFGRQAGSAAA